MDAQFLPLTTTSFPEILGVYRASGDIDYFISTQVTDMAHDDRLYKRITATLSIADVSASIVIENIKDTTELSV